jgi:hypothetical protein
MLGFSAVSESPVSGPLVLTTIYDAAGTASGVGSASSETDVFLAMYPVADIATGSWTNELGGTTLYTSIDDVALDDNDYIVSSVSPSNDTCVIELGFPDFDVGDELIVTYRYGKFPATSDQRIDVTVRLLEGVTQIAEWVHTDVSSSLTTVDQTLTPLEVGAITDFSNLFLEITANAP